MRVLDLHTNVELTTKNDTIIAMWEADKERFKVINTNTSKKEQPARSADGKDSIDEKNKDSTSDK